MVEPFDKLVIDANNNKLHLAPQRATFHSLVILVENNLLHRSVYSGQRIE